MQEKIILMPSADSTELVRSLAARGVCIAGLRIMNSHELARLALTNSGIALEDRLISGSEQTMLVSEVLKEADYFKPAAFADAKLLSAALDELRLTADKSELRDILLAEGTLFPEKNKALLDALEEYESRLKKDGLTDRVSVTVKALKEAQPLDAGRYTLARIEGYRLMPAEEKLLEKLSDGNAEALTLAGLYGTEEKAVADVDIAGITDAYGASNEVEDIIYTIYKNKLPLDRCVVAVTDASRYAQLFSEICGRYGIPCTFGCGTQLTSAYPAKLLRLCTAWASTGCFGRDALYAVIFSETFDRKKLWKKCFDDEYDNRMLKAAVQTAGSLRLCFDGDINTSRINELRSAVDTNTEKGKEEMKALEHAEKIFGELSKGIAYIIGNYSASRKNVRGADDSAARKKLTEQLRQLSDAEICDVCEQLLTGFVRPENSRGGALHITLLEKAAYTLRDNVFIAGLSADAFPGKPAENCLILDCDCEALGLQTSKDITAQRKEDLNRLICTASALGCTIRLSYYSYDLAEVKEENPSSALEETAEQVRSAKRRTAGFFSVPLSKTFAVGKAYNSGELPTGTYKAEETAEATDATDLTDYMSYSPSAIGTYFECPKRFLLERILGISAPDEDDPMTTIAPNDRGTVLHEVMEKLAALPDMSDSELITLTDAVIDSFFKRRPPMDTNSARIVREDIRSMVMALRSMGSGTPLIAEKDMSAKHKSGITLHGLPDRVEEKDGSYLIADFKSGRKIKHEKNDPDTCLQTIIYAYIISSTSGLDIESCEYRYPQLRQKVTCVYDDKMREALDKKLAVFADALKNNDFKTAPPELRAESCKYCKLGNICGKENG